MIVIHVMETAERLITPALAERLGTMPGVIVTGARAYLVPVAR